MTQNNQTLLCRYHYDPLDRLSNCAPPSQDSAQRFYLKNRLTTEIQGVAQCSVVQHQDFLLAQQQRGPGGTQTVLVACDLQRSVLNELDADGPHGRSYAPYGYRNLGGLLGLLGFNGERPDPVTGGYLLGNGYRAFNPVLMRFNSPDSWSPFGKGGLNAYAYCVGDPVNRRDPTGHVPIWLKAFLRRTGLMRNRTAPNVIPHSSRAYRRSSLGSVDEFASSPLSEKTPAWTTQDGLAFAGTEARHPGAPRSAASQESLTSNASTSSHTSDIQPLAQRQAPTNAPPRRRRGADVWDGLMDNAISDLRARYGNGDLTTNLAVSVSDPPPNYFQSFVPPPNYGNEPLPSYQQALINSNNLASLSNRQSLVRRGSPSSN